MIDVPPHPPGSVHIFRDSALLQTIDLPYTALIDLSPDGSSLLVSMLEGATASQHGVLQLCRVGRAEPVWSIKGVEFLRPARFLAGGDYILLEGSLVSTAPHGDDGEVEVERVWLRLACVSSPPWAGLSSGAPQRHLSVLQPRDRKRMQPSSSTWWRIRPRRVGKSSWTSLGASRSPHSSVAVPGPRVSLTTAGAPSGSRRRQGSANGRGAFHKRSDRLQRLCPGDDIRAS